MLKPIAAMLVAAAAPLQAQTPTPAIDARYATPLPGTWAYVPIAGGSEALFRDSAGRTQLTIRCTRTTRRVTIAKPAGGAAPFLQIWTGSMTRNVPSGFVPATALLSADLAATDPLLDALAFSRGRFAVSVAGTPMLVVPVWAEPARVIEDCRT